MRFATLSTSYELFKSMSERMRRSMLPEKQTGPQRKILGILIAAAVLGGWVIASMSDLRKLVSERYPNQVAIYIGGRHSWHTSGDVSEETETGRYILVPRLFAHLEVITVKRVNGGTPTLLEEPIPWWALIGTVGFIACGILFRRKTRNAAYR